MLNQLYLLKYFIMADFIKYKRFTEEFDDINKIQDFLDELITDGWEIIFYYEQPKDTKTLGIIIVAGKKNLGTREIL